MTEERPEKRCVCGRSKALPLCDGSHRSAGWTCSPEDEGVLPFAFVASRNLQNLADRMAHRFGGRSIQTPGGSVECQRLVVVTDGQDAEWTASLCAGVVYNSQVVLAVGVAPSVVQWAFPDAVPIEVDEVVAPLIWKRAEAALLSGSAQLVAPPRPKVFLSHSVRDEAALLPVVDTLRDHFSVPFFVCADSIPAGSQWQEEIRGHLGRCDLFVYAASENANASVFCGFEAGFAAGLAKPIRIVSLDGAPPPAHLQHIQAADVPRLRKRKPWLTETDALLDAFLLALAPD
jgi:hypothetical protein